MNRIERLRELMGKATVGPWTTDCWFVVARFPGARPNGEVIIRCEPTAGSLRDVVPNDDNAKFCAAARNALPDLLAALDAVRNELDDWRLLDTYKNDVGLKNRLATLRRPETDAALARLDAETGGADEPTR